MRSGLQRLGNCAAPCAASLGVRVGWAELPKLLGTQGTHSEQLVELGQFFKVLEAIKC